MGPLPKLILFSAFSLTFCAGCSDDPKEKKHPKDDTEDTALDSADTGDTGEPVIFEPHWWSVSMYFGLRGGVFTNVTRNGAEWFPLMAIVLGNERYEQTRSPKDSCITYFTVVPAGGSAAPSTAFFDWVITPTYLNTECLNLDPLVFGDSPGPYFESLNWEFAAIEADAAFLRNTDEIGLSSLRSNLFAVNVYLNGMNWTYEDEAAVYGFGQEIDKTNAVIEGSYIPVADMENLPDGHYSLLSVGPWRVE